MAEDSGAALDSTLIDTITPLVPGIPERLKTGIDVVDIGCGSGHAVNDFSERASQPINRASGKGWRRQMVDLLGHARLVNALTLARCRARLPVEAVA